LENILQPSQHFERADEALDALIKAIEAEKAKTPTGLFTTSLEQTDRLISRLDEILIEMKKLIEFNQALTVLREIINKERDIVKEIEKRYKEQMQKELRDK
jgi:Mg2+ and Co2+ transporter CorA